MADNMQNEAMERLKQMYSKANPPAQNKTSVRKNNERANHNTKGQQNPERQEREIHEHKPNEHEIQKVDSNEKGNLLDIFMRDKEKSLIVLLIVILISEKADTTLILALMYLIL